ncbi:MAG: peptidase domain-containing ABC transporter [Roseburia sp.]|nr:peptidase domain-containing ABC transporter [Roseburia sp.]
MIAEFYGKKYNLQTLRERSFISRDGVSLMGIGDAAESVGFRTTGLRISKEKLLEDVPLPCIMHWNQNHFVVCYKIKRRKKKHLFYIADPAIGKMKYIDEEFDRHWISTKQNGEEKGIVMVLQPTNDFYSHDDECCEHSDLKTVSYFFKYLRPYRSQIVQMIVLSALFMLLGLIFPFLSQSMIDIGIRNGNIGFVKLLLIAQFILTFTSLSINFLQSWISLHTNTRVNIAIISDFWIKLMGLPMKFFETRMMGDILRRINDHERIETFIVRDSVGIFFAGINFLIYGTVLAIYDWHILVFFLVAHSLYILWVVFFLKYRRKLDYQNFYWSSKNESAVIQMVQGMQEIKLNNCEQNKRWEWEQIQFKQFKNSIESLKIAQIQNFGAMLITQFISLIISYMVAKRVVDGEMTLGMMMAISYVIGQVAAPISQFVGFVRSYQDTKISIERLNEVHETKGEHEEFFEQRDELPDNGDLCFKDMSFSYSGSTRDYSLKHVDLCVKQGEITAFVGESGSGKTTLLKLVLGFYEPTEGTITLGKTNLCNVNRKLWRTVCGSVMQDGFIFSDTIARNIAVGTDDIDKDRLVNSVRIANLSDFIDSLPLGINTKIGMDGNGISQGQKQRILIARAVYKNPEYIIFDEATNALDSLNEREIMDHLHQFYQGKTVLIAAHRLSTIRNAHRIVVLKDGKVVEVGTHQELMDRAGEYCNLVKEQMNCTLD